MSSTMYDRYKSQTQELPELITQISRSLQQLTRLTYQQLPFQRGERETITQYHTRLRDYFDKIHETQSALYQTLPDDLQYKLGEMMASQDIEYRDMIEKLKRGDI